MSVCRRRFLILSACALGAAGTAQAGAVHEWQGVALGAQTRLRIEGAAPGQAGRFLTEAEALLRRVEATFSLHRESELVRLNRSGNLPHPSPAMQELLALTDRLHDATGGAFDPSVQPLWLARASGAGDDRARRLTGWAQVEHDPDRVRLRPGMALTFNGLAQGWAADQLAALAARHGLGDVLIDSGEQRGLGKRVWDVGIAGPDGALLRRMRLQDRALATSSALGTRIGPAGDQPHILDPRGQRLARGTVSVSAATAALADGLSTALCVMSDQDADAALRRFSDARLEWRSPGVTEM